MSKGQRNKKDHVPERRFDLLDVNISDKSCDFTYMCNQEVLGGFVNRPLRLLLCLLQELKAFHVLRQSDSLSLRDPACLDQSYKCKDVLNNLCSKPRN